jgi:adenylosuccinate synthase
MKREKISCNNEADQMKGTVDCLVGLQWGSEGKGKISAYLAPEYNAMVRSGGAQAGHTFYYQSKHFVNRQIPCGVINPNCSLFLSANSLIKFDVLIEEIRRYKLFPDRLMIDRHAMVVTNKHISMEKKESLAQKLASTLEGIGAAQAEKVWRKAKLFDCYACEDPELYFYCGDTAEAINYQINRGHTVLLEGTQGFGLCLNHGMYPFCTSRDVLSSSLLSDAGVAPKSHGHTIGIMRTYPIRVGGNSGSTDSEELSWEEITRRSGSGIVLTEYTTVTKRIRRVFEQNFALLVRAVLLNRPSQIALTFIDYINAKDRGKIKYRDLSKQSKEYINKVENILQIPVTLISTGPLERDIIDRRSGSMIRHASDIPYQFCYDWPNNIYGYSWDSEFVERFIDRKMLDSKGKPWKRKLFVSGIIP